MKDIPGNVSWAIINEVCHARRTDLLRPSSSDDVKSLCLVSKSWVRPCQENLFSSIVLQPTETVRNGKLVRGLDSTLRLAAVLAGSPYIAGLIRKLTYRLVQWETPELEIPEVSFVLEQLKNVAELALVVEEVSRTSSLFWRPCLKPLSPHHFDRFPRHARALSSILELPTLRTLTLSNIELPSEMLYKSTGLQTLDLQRSNIIPPGPMASSRIKESPGEPIKLNILRLDADASDPIMALILRAFYTPKSYGISFAFLEHLSVAVGPPVEPNSEHESDADSDANSDPDSDLEMDDEEDEGRMECATSYILRRTKMLKELHLHDAMAIPSSLEFADSPLQDLHHASWSTLRKLSYDIQVLIRAEDTPIRDPYHSFFKNGAFTALANLEELRVGLKVKGQVGLLVVDAELAEALEELDDVLGDRSDSKLRSVRLAIALCSRPTPVALELVARIQTAVFETAFSRLRRRAAEGELEFSLEAGLGGDGLSDISEVEGEDEGRVQEM